MITKAATLEVDQVFLDLEDAVAPSEKTDDTRRRIADALRDQPWKARTKAVRVNAVSTPWCHRDIITVVELAGEALDCVMLPKVEQPGDVEFADRLLSQLEAETGRSDRIGLEVQIEARLGLMNVERIAASSSRIETLIFGSRRFCCKRRDAAADRRAAAEDYAGDHWHYVLWRILIAARANGLQAIDGPLCPNSRSRRLSGGGSPVALARLRRKVGHPPRADQRMPRHLHALAGTGPPGDKDP